MSARTAKTVTAPQPQMSPLGVKAPEFCLIEQVVISLVKYCFYQSHPPVSSSLSLCSEYRTINLSRRDHVFPDILSNKSPLALRSADDSRTLSGSPGSWPFAECYLSWSWLAQTARTGCLSACPFSSPHTQLLCSGSQKAGRDPHHMVPSKRA